ncbi:uncharacterized protein TNCV_2063712 [Trichonephila clavipes]|nr:uncharacterized protein TNCV_2063712 [Trichonephila clavipes]
MDISAKKEDTPPTSTTDSTIRTQLEALLARRSMEFLGTAASDYAMGPMQEKMNQLDEAFSEMEGEDGANIKLHQEPKAIELKSGVFLITSQWFKAVTPQVTPE